MELRCVEGCKKEGTYPDFSENRGEWGNKKATASLNGLTVAFIGL